MVAPLRTPVRLPREVPLDAARCKAGETQGHVHLCLDCQHRLDVHVAPDDLGYCTYRSRGILGLSAPRTDSAQEQCALQRLRRRLDTKRSRTLPRLRTDGKSNQSGLYIIPHML
eukprot:6189516-Pleurochrysis_carterae.AAC.3